MSELLHFFQYLVAGLAALVLSGFGLYYAGRLVGLGVMRSIHDFQRDKDRLERRPS